MSITYCERVDTHPPSRCIVCCAATPQHFTRVQSRDYWRCEHCGATFLHPSQLPTREAEEREYRLHQNDPHDLGYRQFLARLVHPLLQRIAPDASGLDYGCGPGPALANMLREAGHKVALYDPIFVDDRVSLEQRYAFITCTEVVEHFHQPADEFVKLDLLLEPGGLLAIMTTFQTDDAAFAGWQYRRDPTHVVFYKERTFHELARQHGWQCEIPRANVVFFTKPTAG